MNSNFATVLINLDNLKALSKHNQSFVREILEVYLSNTPKDLEQLSLCVEKDDWPMVRYYAHKLKSSSFTIGFTEGHQMFQRMEKVIKDDEPKDQIPKLNKEIQELCETCMVQVKIELSKYL